jgi:predicted nucleic acid-binding protein
MSILVDTNVLVDVMGPRDNPARPWSLAALRDAAGERIVFSAIVWAELARPDLDEERLVETFAWLRPKREDFPIRAAWLAGQAHLLYRARGGMRERTLPDFLIGAHAQFGSHALLTRDPARYRSYFPDLKLIAPESPA